MLAALAAFHEAQWNAQLAQSWRVALDEGTAIMQSGYTARSVTY